MKLSEINPGDILIADGGFTCIHEGRECEVFEDDEKGFVNDPSDRLYVHCCGERPDFREGDESDSTNYKSKHYLNGQTDFNRPDEIIGFRRK